MARVIKLDQISNFMEGQVEQLLRVVVLEADSRLKAESPVNTGRFRMNWAIGENVNSSENIPEGDYRGQPAPPKGLNYKPGNEKLGNFYSIHNNLPYAESLADGSSPQAKAGWIDLIAKEMQSYARSEYERIKRKS